MKNILGLIVFTILATVFFVADSRLNGSGEVVNTPEIFEAKGL